MSQASPPPIHTAYLIGSAAGQITIWLCTTFTKQSLNPATKAATDSIITSIAYIALQISGSSSSTLLKCNVPMTHTYTNTHLSFERLHLSSGVFFTITTVNCELSPFQPPRNETKMCISGPKGAISCDQRLWPNWSGLLFPFKGADKLRCSQTPPAARCLPLKWVD